MDCHQGAGGIEDDVPTLDPAVYQGSVHGEAELACTDCHQGIEELPHDDLLPPSVCGDCHDVETEAFASSIHGRADEGGAAGVACASCHGTHDILAVANPDSRVNPLRLAETCIGCHNDQAAPGNVASRAEAMQSYLLSVHGRARLDDPTSHAASCNDCHDAHNTQPVASADSRVSRGRVATTCGVCHTDVAEVYFASVHGALAREGNPDVAVCTDCHGEHDIRSPTDRQSTVARSHIAETCARCHEDPVILAKYRISIASPSALYRNSVHGKALLSEQNEEAAACQDCHSNHDIRGGHDPDSTVSRRNIASTCGTCHAEIAQEYNESVHAQAFELGVSESAVCTDCHGEHTILAHSDPDSPVFATRLAKETCGRCHDSMVINRKYGLPTRQVSTYYESYHGLASKLGDTTVANCASCHGAHHILPQSDPDSSVSAAHLAETCGHCHPGATEKFVSSLVHISPDRTHHAVLFWVRRIYMLLIVVTIGFMVCHNLVIITHHVREKYRAQKRDAYVVRFPPTVIAQHMLLTVTFLLLVVTGFSLSFPEAFLTTLLRNWFGLTEQMRSSLHRIAAVGMVATLVWHFISLLCTRRGRSELKALALGWRDARDMGQNLAHHLGWTRSKPRFDRYDYSEKIEYWALIWGSVVMLLSGLLMWFPVKAGEWLGLSKAWVDVAGVVHYYEAWLATLAILIWHFFFVIYHPEEYPMSLSWLTGKMPVDSMAERHPKELERLRQTGSVRMPEDTPASTPESKPATDS